MPSCWDSSASPAPYKGQAPDRGSWQMPVVSEPLGVARAQGTLEADAQAGRIVQRSPRCAEKVQAWCASAQSPQDEFEEDELVLEALLALSRSSGSLDHHSSSDTAHMSYMPEPCIPLLSQHALLVERCSTPPREQPLHGEKHQQQQQQRKQPPPPKQHLSDTRLPQLQPAASQPSSANKQPIPDFLWLASEDQQHQDDEARCPKQILPKSQSQELPVSIPGRGMVEGTGLKPLCGRRRWMGTVKLGLEEAPADHCTSSASPACASLTAANNVWTRGTCTEAADPWQTFAEDALLAAPRMVHKRKKARSFDRKAQQRSNIVRPSCSSVHGELSPDIQQVRKHNSIRVSRSPDCGRLSLAPKRTQASQRLSGGLISHVPPTQGLSRCSSASSEGGSDYWERLPSRWSLLRSPNFDVHSPLTLQKQHSHDVS